MTTTITPAPDDLGLPEFTPEQLRMLATMAQAMEAMHGETPITTLNVPGVTVLPGQMRVIGVDDLQPLVDEFLENQLARGNAAGTLRNYERALRRLVEVCPRLDVKRFVLG